MLARFRLIKFPNQPHLFWFAFLLAVFTTIATSYYCWSIDNYRPTYLAYLDGVSIPVLPCYRGISTNLYPWWSPQRHDAPSLS